MLNFDPLRIEIGTKPNKRTVYARRKRRHGFTRVLVFAATFVLFYVIGAIVAQKMEW